MFSRQDDDELVRLVRHVGESNWAYVADHMSACYSARQCRERWRNYLDPRLDRQSWTDEEDARLVEEYKRTGPRWTMIAGHFHGKSGNTVRNRLFLLQRRNKKKEKNQETKPAPAKTIDVNAMFAMFNPETFTDIGQEYFMFF
jgi:transposase-like protein